MRATCQVCGLPFRAKEGLIANHGHKKIKGAIVNACPGSRELPFEVSRDVLEIYIDVLVENGIDASEEMRRFENWQQMITAKEWRRHREDMLRGRKGATRRGWITRRGAS